MPKAEKAWVNVSVEVAIAAPRPIMATAPSGSGCMRGMCSVRGGPRALAVMTGPPTARRAHGHRRRSPHPGVGDKTTPQAPLHGASRAVARQGPPHPELGESRQVRLPAARQSDEWAVPFTRSVPVEQCALEGNTRGDARALTCAFGNCPYGKCAKLSMRCQQYPCLYSTIHNAYLPERLRALAAGSHTQPPLRTSVQGPRRARTLVMMPTTVAMK